jgi:hypothetical protein
MLISIFKIGHFWHFSSFFQNIHSDTGVSVVATRINAGLTAALFAWAVLAGTPIALANVACIASVIAALWGGALLYRCRGERRVAAILALLASLIWTGVVGGLFAMKALWVANPLIDPHLAAVDAAIGFDHRRFLEKLAAHSWVPWALKIIYLASVPLIFLAGMIHSLRLDLERVNELTLVYAGTLAFTVVISIVTPAIGSFAHYDLEPGLTRLLPPSSGVYHLADFARVRAGEVTVDLYAMNGVVTFPSFHMAMAMIIAMTFRTIPIANVVGLGVSALTMVAAIMSGGHFLADLIGGGAVTAAVMLWHQRASARARNVAGDLVWSGDRLNEPA